MRHVTGYFADQFAATAIVDKLLGRGVPRDRILVTTDESIGDSPASANPPANVISDVSHLGRDRDSRAPGGGIASDRSITPDHPEALGNASVTVVADSEWNETVLRDLLEEGGAEDIAIGSDPLPHEKAAMRAAEPTGAEIDVNRAIEASRRGSRRTR